MNGHNQNKESPYLIYQDENNLYILLMSEKLAVDNFKQETANQCLIKGLQKIILKMVKKDYN